MKIKYRHLKLTAKREKRLQQINGIIEEYQDQGYVLTLRQLYYQLVSRHVIPNAQKEYKNLGELLKDGRMGGIVDWDAIEDRMRLPEKPSSWDAPDSILQSVVSSYQIKRLEGQPKYIELWVEKDALSGVLSPVTAKYHVPIMVNRGYSSATAMHDSYNRFTNAIRRGQSVELLYLGDFDPSGQDMIRDIKDRIVEFYQAVYGRGMDFKIVPLALTKQQIAKYKPPPNPAKMTDSRYDGFVSKHGTKSYEVDALRPDVLHKLAEDGITSRLDMDKYREKVMAESADRLKLEKLADNWDRVSEMLEDIDAED